MEIIVLLMSCFQLITTSPDSITNVESEERLYVYASSGLKLRLDPHGDAEVIDVVPFGGAVRVVNHFDYCAEHQDRIDYMEGYWIQVEHQGITGYLFSGYLSHLPFPSSKDQLVDEGYSFAYTLGEYVDAHFTFQEQLDSSAFMDSYLLDGGVKVRRIWKDQEWTIRIELPGVQISDMLNVMCSMIRDREGRKNFDSNLLFIEDRDGYISEVRLRGESPVKLKLDSKEYLIVTASATLGC